MIKFVFTADKTIRHASTFSKVAISSPLLCSTLKHHAWAYPTTQTDFMPAEILKPTDQGHQAAFLLFHL